MAAQVAARALQAVTDCLATCGASDEIRQALTETEGLVTLRLFADLTSDEISQLAGRMERRAIADRIYIPQQVIKNLQALALWARTRLRRMQPLDAALFTTDILQQTRDDMIIRDEAPDEVPDVKPGKFDLKKWKLWARKFLLYLSAQKSSFGSGIDYVVRPEPGPDVATRNERETELYNRPLTGKEFRADNQRVFQLLFDLVHGTEGYTWISRYTRSQNGRGAWIALKDHYDGGAEERRKISHAQMVVDNIFYKNESGMKFEEFSTKLLEAYRDLEGTESPVTPTDQVKLLLEKLRVSHFEIEMHKYHVRQNFANDAVGAITYLGTEFARMFPAAYFGTNTRRGARHIAATDDRPSQRPRIDDGQPVTTDGVVTYHGVDITNVGRTFSSTEMSQLQADGRRYIFRERDRLGLSRSRRNNPRANQVQVQAVTTEVTPDTVSALTPAPTTAAGTPAPSPTTVSHTTQGSNNGRLFGPGARTAPAEPGG